MEYARSGGAAPPIVEAAVNWGRDLLEPLDLPAGIPMKLRRLAWAYDAMRSYKAAAARHNTVGWTQANPEAWNLVSWALAQKRKR